MDHYALTLRSKDGLQLYVQGWEPVGNIRAVICLLHGLGEHSGRFAHLARFLLPSGFAVISFDLRGHGKSEGIRGHFPSIELVMQDIDALILTARKRYPDVPVFLYGHSLGGTLALYYVLRSKPDLAGVVVTSPGLRTALENQKVKLALARLLVIFAPSMTLPTGLDPRSLSRDPKVVEDYLQDPLVHDRASSAFAVTVLQAINWTYQHASEFQPPLLLMHGTVDQLAYCQGSQEFASYVQGDLTLKLWNGLYHELHNEPENREVFAYLFQWLEKRRLEEIPASEIKTLRL
jgi:alpha-beta hydrolase superfamily lysophospholipase